MTNKLPEIGKRYKQKITGKIGILCKLESNSDIKIEGVWPVMFGNNDGIAVFTDNFWDHFEEIPQDQPLPNMRGKSLTPQYLLGDGKKQKTETWLDDELNADGRGDKVQKAKEELRKEVDWIRDSDEFNGYVIKERSFYIDTGNSIKRKAQAILDALDEKDGSSEDSKQAACEDVTEIHMSDTREVKLRAINTGDNGPLLLEYSRGITGYATLGWFQENFTITKKNKPDIISCGYKPTVIFQTADDPSLGFNSPTWSNVEGKPESIWKPVKIFPELTEYPKNTQHCLAKLKDGTFENLIAIKQGSLVGFMDFANEIVSEEFIEKYALLTDFISAFEQQGRDIEMLKKKMEGK